MQDNLRARGEDFRRQYSHQPQLTQRPTRAPGLRLSSPVCENRGAVCSGERTVTYPLLRSSWSQSLQASISRQQSDNTGHLYLQLETWIWAELGAGRGLLQWAGLAQRAGLVAVGGVALGGGACTEMGHPAKARTAPFQVRPACSLAFLRCLGHFSSLNPFRTLLHITLCNFKRSIIYESCHSIGFLVSRAGTSSEVLLSRQRITLITM